MPIMNGDTYYVLIIPGVPNIYSVVNGINPRSYSRRCQFWTGRLKFQLVIASHPADFSYIHRQVIQFLSVLFGVLIIPFYWKFAMSFLARWKNLITGTSTANIYNKYLVPM